MGGIKDRGRGEGRKGREGRVSPRLRPPGGFGELVLLFGKSDRGISEIHKVTGQV